MSRATNQSSSCLQHREKLNVSTPAIRVFYRPAGGAGGALFVLFQTNVICRFEDGKLDVVPIV